MEETNKIGLLSVVLPAYNEEASVPRAAQVIGGLLSGAGIPHEIIFVDDGSRDHTWEVIQAQAGRYPQVRGVKFSRNFGKEAAIFAGLAQSRGACTVVLDCDLQHPPEKILEMYRLWQEGYQVVEGVKTSRGKENPLHTLAAKTFYSVISNATGIDMSRASDFKLLDRLRGGLNMLQGFAPALPRIGVCRRQGRTFRPFFTLTATGTAGTKRAVRRHGCSGGASAAGGNRMPRVRHGRLRTATPRRLRQRRGLCWLP